MLQHEREALIARLHERWVLAKHETPPGGVDVLILVEGVNDLFVSKGFYREEKAGLLRRCSWCDEIGALIEPPLAWSEIPSIYKEE